MRFVYHLPIEEVSIVLNKNRGTRGHCRGGKFKFRLRPKLGDKAKARLEKLIVVSLAGNAAVNILVGRRRTRIGSSHDFYCAHTFAYHLGVIDTEEAAAYIKWQQLRAEVMLRTFWFLVEAFAEELLIHRCLKEPRPVEFLRDKMPEQLAKFKESAKPKSAEELLAAAFGKRPKKKLTKEERRIAIEALNKAKLSPDD